MSGKHTPAPWRGMYSETKNHGRVLSAIYQPIPGQEYGSRSTVLSLRLAESYSGGEYVGSDCWMQVGPEDEALILKAPEMLAALKRVSYSEALQNRCDRDGSDEEEEPDYSDGECECLLCTARALLAELKEVN